MRFKLFISAAILVFSVIGCPAQQEAIRIKRYDHYIGVQVNQLIRQIINLNNSNTTDTENPYLLVYSINQIDGKWGVSAGIGYNYKNIKDVTPVSKESKINELFYRFGLNRRSMIGKRFEAGYGLDFLGDYQMIKTESASVTVSGSIIDSSESSTTTKATSFGAGPRLFLSYYFTGSLMLGTEISFYYKKSNQKENAIVTDNITDPFNGDNVSTSSSNAEQEVSDFTIALPVAIFLILKF